MKKIFFLLMTLGWLSAIYAQWIQQNSGTTNYLNDVFCISEDTVVVVGNFGTILRTTNGGTQWNTISCPTTEHLNRVKFADSQTGYAVGDNGVVLKTTDAGQTWQSLNTGYNTYFTAISCISADTVYIGGFDELILKTTDGGLSWTTEHTGGWHHIKDIQMISDTLGYAVSDTAYGKIYKKSNANNQWNELPNISSDYVAIHMLNAQEGVFLEESQFFKTSDGGNSFISITSPSYDTDVPCPYDIYATDMNQIWIVGYVCMVSTSNDSGRIVKYSLNNDPNTDYINQIEVAETYNRRELHAITFYNNVGYLVGFDIDNTTGIIYKNTTGQNYFSGSSIDETSKEIYSISPNPTKNQVFINLKENTNPYPVQYRITDLQGKELIPFTALQTYKPIDVSRLTNGIYLIQVQTNGQVYTQKLLIQK